MVLRMADWCKLVYIVSQYYAMILKGFTSRILDTRIMGVICNKGEAKWSDSCRHLL
jgi:hypothetical protein